MLGLWAVWLSAFLVGGCAKPADPDAQRPTHERLVLISADQTALWDAVGVGMEAAQKELRLEKAGRKAVLVAADGTLKSQIALLEKTAAEKDVVGVAVAPLDAENPALAEAMRKLRAKKIPVITVHSDLAQSLGDARAAYVGTNHRKAGQALGRAAARLLPGGGGYALFVSYPAAQSSTDLIAGFADGAGSNFLLLDTLTDDGDPVQMRTNVRNAFRRFGNRLNLVVGVQVQNVLAIADALRELGLRNDCKVVACDVEPRMLELVRIGYLDLCLLQQPYDEGYQAVRLLQALATEDETTIRRMLPNRDPPDGHRYETPFKISFPDPTLKPR